MHASSARLFLLLPIFFSFLPALVLGSTPAPHPDNRDHDDGDNNNGKPIPIPAPILIPTSILALAPRHPGGLSAVVAAETSTTTQARYTTTAVSTRTTAASSSGGSSTATTASMSTSGGVPCQAAGRRAVCGNKVGGGGFRVFAGEGKVAAVVVVCGFVVPGLLVMGF